jgi:hypothetical protein
MMYIKYWHSKLFILTLVVFIGALLWVANGLSISYKEALIFYEERNLLNLLTHSSTFLFGQNSLALRLPFILLYVISVFLMYKMTHNYFKNENDRLISILIFMFLPGIVGASLLVNNAIIVIFCTVLYLYRYKLTGKHNYYLLVVFLFIDNSFAILFLALFFYALQNRQNILLLLSLLLFGLSMYLFGFETSGKPKSHFVDLFAIYASIFSPLIFLYFFYSMYRVGIKGNKSIFWYISMTALIFSFLLSFRQKIAIEDFAPFVVVTIPVMMKLFFHSLRVRLPIFRNKHYVISYTAIVILALNVFVILFNKPFYLLLDNEENHFAYKYHFAKEIADGLKENGINTVYSNDKELNLRLKYYGIEEDKKHRIAIKPLKNYDKKFDIIYFNKNIFSVYYINTYNLIK